MAINISTNPTFTGRFTAVTTGYPYGSSKNETSPGAGDGTPYEQARANDILGFQQALLKSRGIVPSGNADEVRDSQYLQAIVEYASGAAGYYTDSGAADAYDLVAVNADSQGPDKYFDGMMVVFQPANPNTGGAVTVDVAGMGVKSVKNSEGQNPAANAMLSVTTLIYLFGTFYIINNMMKIVSQAEAEAGALTVPRAWTAERVAQAIATLSKQLTALTSATDLDSILTAGDFSWTSSVPPNAPFSAGYSIMSVRTDGTGTTQIAHSGFPRGRVAVRRRNSGVWSSWTYIGETDYVAEQATTSGTSKDFTPPTGVREVTLHLVGISVSSTSPISVRLGTGGTPETTGYNGAYSEFSASAVATGNNSTYVPFQSAAVAAALYDGSITFKLENESNNTWSWSGQIGARNSALAFQTSGTKALAGPLDLLRVYVAGGNFDAGAVRVSYRY